MKLSIRTSGDEHMNSEHSKIESTKRIGVGLSFMVFGSSRTQLDVADRGIVLSRHRATAARDICHVANHLDVRRKLGVEMVIIAIRRNTACDSSAIREQCFAPA